MSERDIKFHRLEDYELQKHGPTDEQTVVCSFETQRFGYLQVGFNSSGLYTLINEPDLHMFSQRDKNYVESMAAIAWQMVFETPAATERFE